MRARGRWGRQDGGNRCVGHSPTQQAGMARADRLSIYSSSTLVGGGEEEERADAWRRRMQSAQPAGQALDHSAHIHDEYPDLTDIGDRVVGGITLSRSGSLSTLHAPQPLTSPAAARTTAQPRIQPPSEAPESELHVPWWSPILPTPIMTRRKSSTLLRNDGRSNSTSPGPAHASTSAPPPVVPPTMRSIPSDRSAPRMEPRADTSAPPSPPVSVPLPPLLPSNYPLYARCYCEENAYLLAAYLRRACRSVDEEGGREESRSRWVVDVVVVSNKNRTVALWHQRASSSAGLDYSVVWDYHVFVVVSWQGAARSRSGVHGSDVATPSGRARSLMSLRRQTDGDREGPTASWVYDLDSRLAPTRTPLLDYLSATFGIDNGAANSLPKRLRPSFRVVPSSAYFTRFASDRSHMKRATGSSSSSSFEWMAPCPPWEIIVGSKAVLSSGYFIDTFVDMRVKVGDGRHGIVVKLEDLICSVGLFSDKAAESEADMLPTGVAALLNGVPLPTMDPLPLPPSHREDPPQAGQQEVSTDDSIALDNDEQEHTPGIVIGGIQRYGIRPPPPPPDGAFIAPNRGKRIMDPLFPAYILSAFEHRAAKERRSIVRFDESLSAGL